MSIAAEIVDAINALAGRHEGHRAPVFFVRTPEDFLAFTRSRVPDPETGKPDLAKVGAYREEHPEALRVVAGRLELIGPGILHIRPDAYAESVLRRTGVARA